MEIVNKPHTAVCVVLGSGGEQCNEKTTVRLAGNGKGGGKYLTFWMVFWALKHSAVCKAEMLRKSARVQGRKDLLPHHLMWNFGEKRLFLQGKKEMKINSITL